MFELPEYKTLARQANEILRGKTIRAGHLGNSPHKFVWYNRKPEEFSDLTAGKTVGEARARGRWLFIPMEPGYMLVLGECGGKVLYHPAGSPGPEKYHLLLTFEDGAALSVMTQMWGAMELFEAGKELERQYIQGMRTTPDDPAFSFDYFSSLIDELLPGPKRSLKSLLTQDQLLPGLGNAIAQDILFRASLLPRRSLADLTPGQRRDLFAAIVDTVREATDNGGRNDETDLFGKPGGYVRIMDSHAAGKPCPECGRTVEKIQYLGGACYFCPKCQI
ncbi:MAG TPA: DNA-formamidopyrimidine glycosylase family protein [Anaerolineales bacterium]|nr:DNA-formamidopyrimidine glycosylase family protein [Anaerolineales bacterium]